MLSTNELGIIRDVIIPIAKGSVLQEFISSLLALALPVLFTVWRRSASKSKIQTAIIDVFVRAIEKSTQQIGNEETTIVKKAVLRESQKAGIEDHVTQAVDKSKVKMAQENGNNSAEL